MKKSLNWTQIVCCLVAGSVGGFIVAVGMSQPLVWTGLFSISAGDWLQAVAAVVGIALTVWATLWLEEQKRKRDRKVEQRLIREALILLKGVLPSASQPLNAEWGLQKRTLMTQAHYEMVRTGLDSLSYARQGYRVRSYNLWNALTGIDVIQANARDRITREERIVRGDNVTDAVLAICREKIEEFSQELLAPINAAEEALNNDQG